MEFTLQLLGFMEFFLKKKNHHAVSKMLTAR